MTHLFIKFRSAILRIMSKQLFCRSSQLIDADIRSELVALDLERGDTFGFNEVATAIWRKLAQPRSFDDLRKTLVAEYSVSEEQCSRELREFLDDLVAKRLVRTA